MCYWPPALAGTRVCVCERDEQKKKMAVWSVRAELMKDAIAARALTGRTLL